MKNCDEIWAEQFKGFPKDDERRYDSKLKCIIHHQRKFQSVAAILTVLIFKDMY